MIVFEALADGDGGRDGLMDALGFEDLAGEVVFGVRDIPAAQCIIASRLDDATEILSLVVSVGSFRRSSGWARFFCLVYRFFP